MYRKTAGVIVLSVVLFVLSISSVSAHDWWVGVSPNIRASPNVCSFGVCNLLSTLDFHVWVTDAHNTENILTISVPNSFSFVGTDFLDVDLLNPTGPGTTLVSASISSSGTHTYHYTSSADFDQLRIMASCWQSRGCYISEAYIDTATASSSTPAFTVTPEPTSTTNSNNDGNEDGSSTPTVCKDSAPGSAPTLVSAVSQGVNSVTLNWTLAPNPVTYYLLTYGITPGAQTYGNPNIGSPNTTSYTVNGLSGGKTYYFRIRAGNGCAPGPYSNELSARVGGGVTVRPAAGFIPEVLGASTQSSPEPTPIPAAIGKVNMVTPSYTPEPVAGSNLILGWVFTHKKVDLGILIVLLAVGYNTYYLRKKNN
jgi:hypothetical protein